MKLFKIDINDETEKNTDYRRVLFTDGRLQLVVMNLNPLQEIGMEVHYDVTQFFHIVSGMCLSVVSGKKNVLLPGQVLIIPAGSEHNIINPSKTSHLKLYTIYTPPEHPAGLIQHKKHK